MIPKTLKNFNLFVLGHSMAGLAEEVTLPKLARKTEDFDAGGMLAPIELDYGSEKLEMDFSLKEYNKEILKAWGVHDASGVGLRFVGAVRSDGDGSKAEAIEIIVRGRWKEIDQGTAKKGESSVMKVTMPLTYYKYTVNGEVLIEKDIINGIEIVGGVDRQAEINTILTR